MTKSARRLALGRRGAWLAALLWLPMLGCGAGLQAEDDQTTALVQRAKELYQEKKYELARDKAALALKRSPDNPQALYLRGLAELALKDYAAARGDLEAAQKIDPLAMFAESKEAFQKALKTARDNTVEAYTGDVKLPAAKPPPAELNAPATPDKPKPPKPEQPTKPAPPAPPPKPAKPDATTPAAPRPPADPRVAAVSTPGIVVKDLTGQTDLGDDRQVLQNIGVLMLDRGLTLKVLVVDKLPDPAAEAKRIFEAAKIGDATLLVVATSDKHYGAYTPTLDSSATQQAVDDAIGNKDAPLGRQLVAVVRALSATVEAPPAAPSPAPETAPAAAQPAATAPPPGRPRAIQPWAWLVGGALLGIALFKLVGRVLARRRLARAFGSAGPQVALVADRLSEVLRDLLVKRDRVAAQAHEGAELAFMEAVAMMHQAAADDTGDIARVERAGRLLDEAADKLQEAAERLAQAADAPSGRIFYCYFTGRPMTDRHDGDLVLLRRGDEQRLVLAHRRVGEALRRGERPPVRVVETSDGLVHWACAGGYDPVRHLYHEHPHGHRTAPIEEVLEPLFDDPDGKVFVDLGDRPDYTLELGGERS